MVQKDINLAGGIILVLVEIVMWYIMINYRNHRLVKVRGLPSLAATSGCWALTGIFWNFAAAFDSNCLFWASVTQFLHVVVSWFFTEKFMMIVINFAINQEAINYVNAIQASMQASHNRSSVTGKPVDRTKAPFSKGWSKWLFDHRHYFTAKWNSPSKIVAFILVFVYTSIFVAIFAVQPGAKTASFNSPQCFDVLMWWWRGSFFSGAVPAFGVLGFFFSFMKVKESFFLKQELFLYCFVGIFCVLCFSYRLFTPKEFQMKYDDIASWYGIVLLGIGTLENKLIWAFLFNKIRSEKPVAPLCNDNAPSTEQRPSSRDFGNTEALTPREKPLETFRRLLADDEERNKFRDFLVTEFAVENLLFWEEVETLARLEVPEERCAKAMQIYNEFCSEHSKLTVNLSSLQFDTMKSLYNRLTAPDCDVQAVSKDMAEPMGKAQHEIVLLMLQDSYPRYKRYMKARGLGRGNSLNGQSFTAQPISPSSRDTFPVQELQI